LGAAGVQRLHDRAQPQLDFVLVVEVALVYVDLPPVRLAAQILLRQGRPFIRPIFLGPHQHHPSVEPFLAQRLRGLGAREAGADAGAEFGVGVEVAVGVVGAAMEVVAGGGGGGGARTMNESAARTPLSPTSVTTRWCEPGARAVNVTCVEPCRVKRPSST